MLQDKTLRLEIELLNNIIEKINKFNTHMQNKKFCLYQLKTEMRVCFNSILELVCKPEKFGVFDFKTLQDFDWESINIQQEWFLNNEEFLEKIAYKIHYEFKILLNKDPDEAEKLAENYKKYIAKLLNLTLVYLPFKDKIIEAVDFVEMKDNYNILENKIIYINNVFNIISEKESMNSVFSELLRLKTSGEFFSFFQREDDSITDVWNRISCSSKYSSISKFFKLAEILPISSVGVEQAFSIVKLFKTDQRNSLSEESLEGLLLLFQACQEQQVIEISAKTLEMYKELKENLKMRKNSRKDDEIEEEKNERRKKSFQDFLVEANPTLKKTKKTAPNSIINLEDKKVIPITKEETSITIHELPKEEENLFESLLEKSEKNEMEIECFKLIDNSLSSDPFKHLDSDVSELGEEGDTNQKKKVQKREKVK